MGNSIPGYFFAGYSKMNKKKESFYGSCEIVELGLSIIVNIDFMGVGVTPEGPVEVVYLKSALLKDNVRVDAIDSVVGLQSWYDLSACLKNSFSMADHWKQYDYISNDTVWHLINNFFANVKYEDEFNDIRESYPSVTVH
ncbi:hypothetical protein PQD71_gp051 [Kosakonia phage Kc263]|uniref:Uncharacterized protein n=1 Tax=Kosakonia phage Kc263 TaxID=2863194 RepID=A0AAE8BIJ4_9CAUD|nr:hypothetical protein PQD71_gp051 [Kosakonia phage Kc263]QYN79944.1 hypothetical protein [Kosakonia phage Kc263]